MDLPPFRQRPGGGLLYAAYLQSPYFQNPYFQNQRGLRLRFDRFAHIWT